MRAPLACLLLTLVAAGALRADERGPELSKTAAAVLAAWHAGDATRLTELAARDLPDPWLIADELCRWEAVDAALAFAEAHTRADVARLADYVEARRDRPADPDVRAAIERAGEPVAPEDREAVLALLEAQLGRGDAFEQVYVSLEYGNLLSDLGRRGEALDAFFDGGRTAEALGWFSLAQRTYEAAGTVAYHDENYEAMAAAWKRLLAVQQGRGDETGTAHALMLVGGGYVELADFEQAERYLLESTAAFEALEDDDGLAWALNNMAFLHSRRGEPVEEQRVLDRARRLAVKAGNPFRLASVLADLASLHFVLRDLDRAMAYATEARDRFRALDWATGVATCLGTLGEIHRERGEYDLSVACLEQALAHYREADDQAFVCAGLNDLGLTLLAQGELQRARQLEEESVAVARTLGNPWYLCHALQSLADVHLALEQYEEAEGLLDESLRVAAGMSAPELVEAGHRGLAELWLKQERYARAVQVSQRAMDARHARLTGLDHGQAARAREGAAHLYEIAVRSAHAWGRPAALFAAVESVRAGVLLEMLENREAIRKFVVPEALREEEAEARKQLHLATLRLRRAMRSGKLRERRRQNSAVNRARDRLHLAIGRIQRDAKQAAHVLHPLPVALDELQEELQPHEAFVAYSVLGEQALALVVTSAEARIVDLGASRDLAQVDQARPTRSDVDPEAGVQALRAKLVTPLHLSESTTRLLVSPDGALGILPFALLAPDREVTYVPSATAYCVLQRERPLRGEGVLALGNPDYRVPDAAPEAIAVRGGMRLVPLPATGEEARRVGDVVLLGSEATPKGFLAAVGKRKRWEAVHLACHGLVNSSRPMQSALALSFAGEDSNLLTCAEVFRTRIPTDLAVLSACETGKGAIYRTEGIVGLTQAFMLAGSPRVLVSLWKVDDEATQALMVKFYEYWRPGDGGERLGAAAALRKAQLDVNSQPKWKHPYYWAAWVLWGLPD